MNRESGVYLGGTERLGVFYIPSVSHHTSAWWSTQSFGSFQNFVEEGRILGVHRAAKGCLFPVGQEQLCYVGLLSTPRTKVLGSILLKEVWLTESASIPRQRRSFSCEVS